MLSVTVLIAFVGCAAFAGVQVEALMGGDLICNRTEAEYHSVGSELCFYF